MGSAIRLGLAEELATTLDMKLVGDSVPRMSTSSRQAVI